MDYSSSFLCNFRLLWLWLFSFALLLLLVVTPSTIAGSFMIVVITWKPITFFFSECMVFRYDHFTGFATVFIGFMEGKLFCANTHIASTICSLSCSQCPQRIVPRQNVHTRKYSHIHYDPSRHNENHYENP